MTRTDISYRVSAARPERATATRRERASLTRLHHDVRPQGLIASLIDRSEHAGAQLCLAISSIARGVARHRRVTPTHAHAFADATGTI